MDYIENRTFDEIQVGDSASLVRTLTPQDVKLFAVMSGDVNPAHVDEEYARSDMFHKIIAHGMWGGALISTLLGTRLPGPGAIYLGQTLKFLRPVALGDTVTVTVTVAGKDPEILTGAALIRERERGRVEHLLVMPVTPFEIMTSKVWSMGLVVLVTCSFSLVVVVQGLLSVPIQGSIPLFLCGAALSLFAATSLGMFLATFARTMPQFALLLILVLMPLQMLSGGMTPRESMPEAV
jgi:ABC-2 type transport system permease protein